MEPDEYPHVFRTSAQGGYFGLFIGFSLLVVAGWESVNHPPNFTAVIFFLCLGAASILFSIKSLAYPSVALKLAPTGLWTPTAGFLRWKFIQVKIESVYSGKAGSMDYLIVTQRQTQRRIDAIAIAGLSGSASEIGSLLTRYKHN